MLNEYGDTKAKMLAWTPPANPHLARFTELKAVIDSWGEDVDAALPYSLESKRYTLDMKPRQQQRDMGPATQEAAFRAMEKIEVVVNHKVAGFNPFEVFETTIKSITEQLGLAWLDRVAPKGRTGRRDWDVTSKINSALQKAA